MNEQPKTLWEKMVDEPRRFFLWLAAGSLAFLILLAVVGNAFRHTPPSSFAWMVGAYLLVGAIFGFLTGFFGFFLALIPPLKSLFRWIVRRSALLVAALITLVALFYAQENWRGRRAWENFKRDAAAKNEPLELKEIIPPPVPDDQNFAAAPLLQEMCKEFDTEWREQHTGPNGVTNAADRLKLRYLRPNETGPDDPMAYWQTGRRTDLKAWQDYYRNPSSPATGTAAQAAFAERYGLPPAAAKVTQPAASNVATNEFPIAPQPQSPAADVLLALSKYDTLIEELRTAAERSRTRFPIRYEEGFSAQLPHLARLKGISQFLALRAAAEIEAGQSDKAAADVKLGLRLADALREEPFLISQLVRIAQVNVALSPLWEGLVAHGWSDAQLAGFEQHLAGEDLLVDYQRGMRGERVCCLWTMDYVSRERRPQILNLSPQAERTDFEDLAGILMFQLVPRGWWDQNKASIGRLHLELAMPAVDLETHRIMPATVQRLSDSMYEQLNHRSPYKFFARLLLPALANAATRSARAQSSVDLARVACALERHRLATGQYPDKLDALAPRFLSQLPHDLINGEPLHYQRTEAGSCILYSIGWNNKDDGGKFVIELEGKRANWKEGDWVWPMAAN